MKGFSMTGVDIHVFRRRWEEQEPQESTQYFDQEEYHWKGKFADFSKIYLKGVPDYLVQVCKLWFSSNKKWNHSKLIFSQIKSWRKRSFLLMMMSQSSSYFFGWIKFLSKLIWQESRQLFYPPESIQRLLLGILVINLTLSLMIKTERHFEHSLYLFMTLCRPQL